jgi:hypothetical protein
MMRYKAPQMSWQMHLRACLISLGGRVEESERGLSDVFISLIRSQRVEWAASGVSVKSLENVAAEEGLVTLNVW